jgi:hypothetical protein
MCQLHVRVVLRNPSQFNIEAYPIGLYFLIEELPVGVMATILTQEKPQPTGARLARPLNPTQKTRTHIPTQLFDRPKVGPEYRSKEKAFHQIS